MSAVLNEDINSFVKEFPLSREIENASFLITGATGLVGSILVRCLLALGNTSKIVIPVRNKAKALSIYGDDNDNLTIVECDLIKWVSNLDIKFDYIIHCASPTSGQYMVSNPVETYTMAIESNMALLRYARRNSIKGMVFLSSVEYYGHSGNDEIMYENYVGDIDRLSPRSSYPLGKRSAEYMCFAYAHQYGIPVKIARLTQTFGPGVSFDDNRVFVQFAKSVLLNRNIVLHTLGDSAKPYCYTIDCVTAILTILIRGLKGEAYNVANEGTYISIKDLALFLKQQFNKSIDVVVELHPEYGYAPPTRLHISTEKIKSLGWVPRYGLYEMFNRLIIYLRDGE